MLIRTKKNEKMETPIDPTLLAIIGAAIYEIGVRLLPTIKDYTIVGKVIKAITWIHKFLNVKKVKK